jgi:hypothetical protein
MLALLTPDVQTFLAAHPAIPEVLDAMAEPLHACFGQHTAQLEVLTDGEDGDFLRLPVHMPYATPQEAAAALKRFDETWWVQHCHRTEGRLVVDDAVEGPP